MSTAPLLLVPPETHFLAGPQPAPEPAGPSPHQIETDIADIRREMARLQRREAALLAALSAGRQSAQNALRAGWPMRRL